MSVLGKALTAYDARTHPALDVLVPRATWDKWLELARAEVKPPARNGVLPQCPRCVDDVGHDGPCRPLAGGPIF